jgi:serine/threonine-protein kinase
MPSRPLGPPGGFGEVFLGRSAANKPAAVKRIKLASADGAHRELKMAEYLVTGNFKNVMPILDSGKDPATGTYFIVMPVAECSLQDAIAKGAHDVSQAVEVMLQITNGLTEVQKIVHRDLKPGNVLMHRESWKITDFGIARFADTATASDTLKDVMSAHYAAPEQWRFERATSATDVYALGCIGYALLTGAPPFIGSRDALREHHLGTAPPSLPDSVPAQFKTLLSSMLRKAPESRPTISKVTTVLNQLVTNQQQNYGVNALATAAAKVESIHATHERQASVENMARNDREILARTGKSILAGMGHELLTLALAAAPNAAYSQKGEINLGLGVLHLPSQTSKILPPGLFKESGWDVVLGEAISAVRNGSRKNGDGYVISASLWYAKLPKTDQYRWYEVSYWGAFRNDPCQPYELTDKVPDADKAAAPVLHVYDICWGPLPIDDDDADEFNERWLALFAKAADGSLARPRTLPLRRYFWKDRQF